MDLANETADHKPLFPTVSETPMGTEGMGTGHAMGKDDASRSPTLEAELDGNDTDPIAICGLSLKFPQEATSSEAFWEMLIQKRCATTEFPASRLNLAGFRNPKNKLNNFQLHGGHFITEDLSVFDAEFFSISPTEAASMDPMQRWLLETTYRALENAGIPVETVSGSSTAVYTGCFGQDYSTQLYRDAENPPAYAAVGLGLSMLANRLSWFFDFRGPSVGLDSACSSTAMALDIACQALHNKACNMGIVAGCNLTFSPETYTWMTNINFLSKDSRCFSFDHRANGYARGEGVAVIVLKRLSDAIRDGNTIRAIIRSTSCNEDGRTPGITQPSGPAQERLIRETYRKAGLSMAHTRYFEAHGTGTVIGDPREAQAIGLSFRKYRTVSDPLFVGAVKSNIGHLEGASGLASVIKAILALEKGIIPPNTNFEKINPRIDPEFLRIKFPQESHPWPTPGLRRASVNSFGYGGANAHIVLDDAYNYLRLRRLPGKHRTNILPPPTSARTEERFPIEEGDQPFRLIVLSAADQLGISRLSESFESYASCHSMQDSSPGSFLGNLAYTLDSHRSHLTWRSFCLLRSPEELCSLRSRLSVPIRVHSSAPRIGFVFTGQGAQWYAMGREMLKYPVFKRELTSADKYLKEIGCEWSVYDEFVKSKELSNVDKPEISQTLCTVLQLALVNLLRLFGVQPCAVVGHSSGEIAAAYSGGYISTESALRLAYLRGKCSNEIVQSSAPNTMGSMMSVGLPEEAVRDNLTVVNQHSRTFGVSIACINSPRNVTVAGEEHIIDQLKARFDEQKVFTRKLRVTVAYHSEQMKAVTKKYESLIGSIPKPPGDKRVPMISSVTGEQITTNHLTDPSYWALNMESPVQFLKAINTMCAQSELNLIKKIDKSHLDACVVTYLVEIGPHAALQGPLREIMRACPRGDSIGYGSVLKRGQSATESTLSLMGSLHSIGVGLDLRVINDPSTEERVSRSLLVDLPEYPFDHSQKYWHESRLSANYRFRQNAPAELLGVRSRDWNPSDARWRHFLRAGEMPWIQQHVVNGTILYPAAGMICMAIEAAKQLAVESAPSQRVNGYTLRDIRFDHPINLTNHTNNLEVQTSLRKLEVPSDANPTFEFAIRTYTPADDNWIVNCRGIISVDSTEVADDWMLEKTATQRQALAEKFLDSASHCKIPVDSHDMYSFLKEAGLEYGPLFQGAQHQKCDTERRHAVARVAVCKVLDEPHVIHPATLDAIFHLCFTALTSGGSYSMGTSIPSRLSCLWISDTCLSWPDQDVVSSLATITNVTTRGFSCAGMALNSSDQKGVKLWYDGLELTNVATQVPSTALLQNRELFCMNIDLKVALDKLSPQETQSLLERLHPATQDLSRFSQDAELLIEISLKRLIQSIDVNGLNVQEEWKHKYCHWAEYHLAHRSRQLESSIQTYSESIEELIERLSRFNHVGRLYAEVALNLEAIMRGEISPLELLLQTNLLKDYYEELTTYKCALQISTYMDLLAHQSPGLQILEVGGGTGAGTRNLVNAISTRPGHPTTQLRCGRYGFTDISAAFLGKAREEFGRFQSQMTFGTLDIERDFVEQGFVQGTYDVVLALGVLHVTADLASTLKRVRRVLKPGGKLIMQESFNQTGWTMGFVFGLFPGWWLGSEDGRLLSPNISVDAWDAILRENGFSGADIVLRDFDQDVAHHYGWLISTAVDEVPSLSVQPYRRGQVTIIVDETSAEQCSFASKLLSPLEARLRVTPTILSIETAVAASKSCTDDLFIFLADYGASFLQSLDAKTWTCLKSLVERSRHLLWVTTGGGRSSNPDHAMLDGLARTLRQEYYDLHLVTLALDAAEPSTGQVPSFVQVVEEMLTRAPHQAYEQDYTQIDGLLHTRRLVEACYLQHIVEEKVRPFQSVSTTLGDVTSFVVGTPEQQITPHYIQTSPDLGVLQFDEVAIKVKAVSILPREDATVLDNGRTTSSGRYCSGIVVDTGRTEDLRPGNRVLAFCPESFRSHVRVSSQMVASLPPILPFSDACQMVPLIVAVYHVLMEVGCAKVSDTILVHDGFRPVGRAALQFLADQGITDVYTTATDKHECSWIADNFGLPPERILPKSWFNNNNPMLVAQWKQAFDIVLTAEDAYMSSLSTVCIRPGGRSILLRTGWVKSPATNAEAVQASQTSIYVFIVDVAELEPSPACLRYAVKSSEQARFKNEGHETAQFCAHDLNKAMSTFRSANNKDTIVVTFDDDDIIDIMVKTQPAYSLNPEATYLIAGGLGGLGRAIACWLVSRGARFLILLSRSGPRTLEAKDLLTELATQQVHVEAPCCDVADKEILRSVLASCSERMPPVRGCVQASMVMTECIFGKMEFRDWKASIDPKVRASWNLHVELPKGLDFFVMISSIMGILGTRSLSAYNAGNTYQDALARMRVSQNERAVALDLGAVVDGGYLTEHSHHIANLRKDKKVVPILVKEVCALLEIYCDPENPFSLNTDYCQSIVGIRPPPYWKHVEDIPPSMTQPFWGHMHHVPAPASEVSMGGVMDGGKRELMSDAGARVAATRSLTEAAEIISEALAQHVSNLLGISEDRLDAQKPMHSYGMDSLSALDLRNWAREVFGVEIPVFEILGGATFTSAGQSLARKVLQ